MSRTRKQNGEGSVFQVSENKWVAKISMGQQPNGKPFVKQFSGKTEAIVKKKLKDFKKSKEFIERRIPNNDTVETYFLNWLHEYKLNKLKPTSYDRLEGIVLNHIIPNIGSLKLDKVTQDQIQSLINKLYKQKQLSYSSVKKVYVALNDCYNHALIADAVAKNPCLGVVLPSLTEKTKQINAFKPAEVEALLNEIRKQDENGESNYFYGNAFILILNTGLRMGEALSLCWDDVDFEKKTITIQKNRIMTKKRDLDGNSIGGYELLTQDSTKTVNGKRVVPINKTAEEALIALKTNNNTPFVIVNNRNSQVLPSNFIRSFHGVLSNAGLEQSGVHILRHTFASMLFRNGIDVKIVSKLLGHSSVKITYDIYVHLFEEDISHITDVLD